MKWVTRADVGIDRMGCAWLIRRFIDPDAEFLFVRAPQEALPEGAEPFDMPGVRLSHRKGHASFRTFLEEYWGTPTPDGYREPTMEAGRTGSEAM